jgi:hypothetical protein
MQVNEINSIPGVTWTAAVQPRFAADAPGISKKLCGIKGNWKAEVGGAFLGRCCAPVEIKFEFTTFCS